MRLKTRTIAGGLVVVGAVIGTMMSGLLPGLGPGSGVGVQVSASGDPNSSSPDTPDEPQPEPVPVDEPPATTVEVAAPPSVLEVRVDQHDYLIPDDSDDGFRQAQLTDIVKLAQSTTGNDDGIRVRIMRTKSARLVAWSTLHDALAKSGLARDSIRMPKELID
jgi:hypothetical protein